MSKISIKTDFTDGEKLFAQDLNNNFLVIQAGINANEEHLQEVIDKAIIELDKQLEEITADRGWDWNGGDRVTFYKGNAQAIEDREIINGQLLYNTDSGETALDDNNTRIVTGSGNVVSVSEEEPTNPSTKIWIKPSKMARYAASYVVDSMEGTDTDKAPSVNAVKEYVKEIYSTNEVKTNKIWIDGKPIYRKVINSTCPSKSTTWATISSNLNADEILSYTGYIEFNTSEHKLLAVGTAQFTYFQLNKTSHELQIATNDSGFFGKPIKVIIEYTKIAN